MSTYKVVVGLAALLLAVTACQPSQDNKAQKQPIEAASAEPGTTTADDGKPPTSPASPTSDEGTEPVATDPNTVTKEDDPVPTEPTEPSEERPALDALDRDTFNKMAVRLFIPLFWRHDTNQDGIVQPDEVVTLLFYPQARHIPWRLNEGFSAEFYTAYQAMLDAWRAPLPEGLEAAEAERLRWVIEELDEGKATLVYNDLRSLSEHEKAFVNHILQASAKIDRLYARQNGLEGLIKRLPAGDWFSQALFHRNWGPRCKSPKTERVAACSALAGVAKVRVDVYPAALQADEDFCTRLEAHPDNKALLDPFTVVKQDGQDLVAVPYTSHYQDLMQAIAADLRQAATAIGQAGEDALVTYLEAAAQAFEDNHWEPADEAWAAMNARNSRWYVRVAPDETYWEPCSRKAGFHLTLARINTDSLYWQDRLAPVQQEMEAHMAEACGAPYQARPVSFQLPDFIDIVSNAGDDRNPFGATIGQSLPNWGPVANEGRGRTVVMSNLYTDPDSMQVRRTQAAALFVPDAMSSFVDAATPNLLGTILHEAAHNFGPSHEYKVDGKTDNDAFGGPLATLLEELKAQTAAMWYIAFLQEKGLIDADLAHASYADAVFWALSQISRGLYTAEGRWRPYPQLAAIQIGFLIQEGAMRFDPELMAANGTDRGAFVMDFERFPQALDKLMRLAGGIKARGDRELGESLRATHVDGKALPLDTIAERLLRFPRASFVYAVEL